ncbi:MAG: hypothetical protein MJ231_05130 [bacterium]|nr:hypothetical protein [bacterium]
MPINVAKIYSTLGNPSSLIPLAVKDLSSAAGMTAGSFVTGKEEGHDRLIDELGTEVIWLFGIPAFKKLFDLVVFKAFGLDSKFDARNFKDKAVLEKVKEFAPDETVKKEIENIINKKKLFKHTTSAKFFVSTGLAITSYVLLTAFKQKYTDKKIRENLIKEYNEKKASENENCDTKNPSSPSFKGGKGIEKAIEYFAFDPVRNMWILDGSITYERLKNSRNPQEFAGYAIKEGSLLFFMYYLGGKIQQLMENRANKKFNKSIGLDARVLEDDLLKKSFEDGSIAKCLKQFADIKPAQSGAETAKNSVELYEFLHKNPENMIVKVAKKSDIIKLYKDTEKIDTRKFIDLKEVEGINDKISKLYEQYKEALKKGETTEQFFKGVKKLKRGSIKMNIFSSIFALGVLTPALMLLKRFTKNDDTEFETKKRIREELIKEGVIV